jgi:hypothetical protein
VRLKRAAGSVLASDCLILVCAVATLPKSKTVLWRLNPRVLVILPFRAG